MKIVELIKKSLVQIKKSARTSWTVAGLYFVVCFLAMLDSLFKAPTVWISVLAMFVNVVWGYWFMRYFLLISATSKRVNIAKVFSGSWTEFWGLIRLELLVIVAILIPMLIGLIAGTGFWSFKNYLGFGIVLAFGVCFVFALIWFSLRLGFAYYLVIDEKTNARKSLSRSMEITKGKMKQITLLLLQYLLLVIPLFGVEFVIAKLAFEKMFIYAVVQSGLSVVYGLFGGLTWVNFYREIRTLKIKK